MQSKDFLKKNRFLDYLKYSQMYKEMYSSKEGIISICFALITCVYISNLQNFVTVEKLSNIILTFLGFVLGGGFGLLGFLVGGLGILIGSISDDMISKIDANKKFLPLLKIMFRFYYDGAALVILIVLSVIDYAALLMPLSINLSLLTVMSFLTSYFFLYTLLLSMMLLGTSIRLLVLRHNISD